MKRERLSISERGINMPSSAMRKLVPYAEEAQARGMTVIPLNIGQPDIETPPVFWEAVREFPERVLAYGPSAGRQECREGVVAYYSHLDIDLKPEHLIITTAGSEAVLFALLAVGDPGDEIIVPEPFYSNYASMIQMAGMKLVPFTTYAQHGYHLPEREVIERLVTERTRAILYASPGNPTGVVYTREEIAMLGDIARSHGLFVMADEVYREFSYDGQIAASLLHTPGLEEHAIVLDSVSKRYSACGARVGCLITRNEALMAAIMKMAMSRLSAPVLEQAGIAACLHLPPDNFTPIRETYTRRRDLVFERLNQMEGVFCPKPAGAFYVMPTLEGIETEPFARWLLTDFEQGGETVLVAPGAGFYWTPGLGRDKIRIAYVLNTDRLARAMDLLEVAIHRYREEEGS